MKKRIALLVSLVLLIPATLARSAAIDRQQHVVASGPGAQFAGYATPVVVLRKGDTLQYTNIDIVQHDVVHDVSADGLRSKKRRSWCARFPRKNCPLFWSARVGLGSSTAVKGVETLKSGEIYSFFCTLHPGMKGKLVIAP